MKKLLIASAVAMAATNVSADNRHSALLDGAVKAYVMSEITVELKRALVFPALVRGSEAKGDEENSVSVKANGNIAYSGLSAPDGSDDKAGKKSSFKNNATLKPVGRKIKDAQAGIIKVTGHERAAYKVSLTTEGEAADSWKDSGLEITNFEYTLDRGSDVLLNSEELVFSDGDGQVTQDIRFGATLRASSTAKLGKHRMDLVATVSYR